MSEKTALYFLSWCYFVLLIAQTFSLVCRGQNGPQVCQWQAVRIFFCPSLLYTHVLGSSFLPIPIRGGSRGKSDRCKLIIVMELFGGFGTCPPPENSQIYNLGSSICCYLRNLFYLIWQHVIPQILHKNM